VGFHVASSNLIATREGLGGAWLTAGTYTAAGVRPPLLPAEAGREELMLAGRYLPSAVGKGSGMGPSTRITVGKL
jgi:hypothetical protein